MVALGLGSNLGNRKKNILSAIWEIEFRGLLKNIRVSKAYESDALIPRGAPSDWDIPFLNVAICGETECSPFELLDRLKEIEKSLGRKRRERWAPREIDLDILSWRNTVIEGEQLKVPHPEILKRPFVLLPLLDLKLTENDSLQIPKLWQKKTPFNTKPVTWLAGMPQLVGILNVTPDSFSDGDSQMKPEQFVERFQSLVAAGSQVIDIGAESTRPGAKALSSKAEMKRLETVLPQILKEIKKSKLEVEISLDSYHPETAKKFLGRGLHWLNDVSGMNTKKMISTAVEQDCEVVLMHNLGVPADKKKTLSPKCDPVKEIKRWAEKKIHELEKMGIQKKRLIFDPGIGFGKSAVQSFEILERINEFADLKMRIMVGHSRKSFLSEITSREFSDRDIETVAVSSVLAKQRIHYLRVHNVDLHQRAFSVLGKFSL